MSSMQTFQFVRSLTASPLPLFALKLYIVLGYGWGNSTIAFVALAVVVPLAVFVWIFGSELEARAQ